MDIDQIDDNEDRIVALLEQVVANTGGGAGTEKVVDVDYNGSPADSRVGLVPPRDYTAIETDDMAGVEEGGTVTVEPGETEPLVIFEQPCALLAAGAVDEANVTYNLEANNRWTIGGETNSPLGLLNDPFSFVQMLGGAIPIENSVVYYATLDSSADAPVDLAARLHVESLEGY